MAHEHPMPYLLRRQDLPSIYYYNCVLDVTRPRTIREQQSMTGKQILPFALPPEEVIDIDRPIDLRLAEFLFGDRG
jgi:CMP-N-acetylneuraminic acid synthetase